MNILVVDAQGLANAKLDQQFQNHLYFALARFSHRINGASVHLSRESGVFRCYINVNVERSGFVSVQRTGESIEKAVSLAVHAIEPKVASRIDWRNSFNSETFSRLLVATGHSIKWLCRSNPEKSFR